MQAGPVYGYPRISRFSVKLAAYAQLARPFTVFAAFLVGFFLGLSMGQTLLVSILFGLSLAMAQGFGQVINQVADVDIDRLNKPYRPIPRGIVSEAEATAYGTILLLIGFATSMLISPLMGLMYILVAFFAAFYSLEPIRAKKRLIINVYWQALSRGLLPPIIASLVFLGHISLELAVLATLAFMWVYSLQSTKDFGDEDGDRAHGVKTLPVVLGREGALSLMKILMASYLALLTVYIGTGLVHPAFITLGVLGALSFKYLDTRSLLENNIAWNIFYIGLGLHYLLWLLFY